MMLSGVLICRHGALAPCPHCRAERRAQPPRRFVRAPAVPDTGTQGKFVFVDVEVKEPQ